MARTRPLTMPMRRAWARAWIHLNLGDFPAAVQAGREASALTEWDRFGRVHKLSDVGIYGTAEMPLGWCWFEPARWRVLISSAALMEFGPTEHLYTYVDLATRLGESTFRSYDPANWRALDAMNEYGYGPPPFADPETG